MSTPSTPCEYSEYATSAPRRGCTAPPTASRTSASARPCSTCQVLTGTHRGAHRDTLAVLTGVLTGVLEGYSEYSRLARLLRVLVDLGDPVAAVAGGRRAALVLDDLQVERLRGQEECELIPMRIIILINHRAE